MKVTLPFALAATLALGSCASIVSKSRYPVAINSVPVGADVTVTNRAGKEVFAGKVPTAVMLKSGAGFFKKEIYTLTFKKAGYDDRQMTLEANLNGWYFGNIVFGGLIGMLIVDPATGAMYRIAQRDVQGVMAESAQGSILFKNDGLSIISTEDVPADLRDKMVPIEK
ncbi:hypothetical protein F1C16_15060 [Hymenobacter sp. NBH84]|uniref:hypothetical protein n=1 Tax=Hymenobacter sp. NBH84 TaxID=2596915 RepID=UPI0016276F30|nr:hypothetical protein [Hymenobacter sp. NBH84]QNE40789.1 hypothetical protein F1C16_15060 [Hymenobacter sp. NBH84]